MYVSGGLNPRSYDAEAHAIRVYESIRKQRTDYIKIAKNTGFSIEQIQLVKNYIFNSYHSLYDSVTPERFYPSYEMAESWRRLSEPTGKHIKPHDRLLISHELYEINLLLNNSSMSQGEAHDLATKVYNYQRESDLFYAGRSRM